MGADPVMQNMKRLCVGLLAHVDAGKTTLSEALLYKSGAIRRQGRVDHGDAFLDTDPLERERGITILAKQAELTHEAALITLLDTPGHVDFSAETERTLQVLDAAVLVLSASDGVQSHTRTLWQLLTRYSVPTFLFINKMDLPGADRAAILGQLQSAFGEGFVDWDAPEAERAEAAATLDESALEAYLDRGALSDEIYTGLIAGRRLFPCFFGAALRLEGTEALLSALARFCPAPDYGDAFGARVFKISRDAQGARLTHMKITGGTLRVKDLLPTLPDGGTEKVDQIRVYSGAKYQTIDAAGPGTVCCVTGLSESRAGQGFGIESARGAAPLLEPVLSYAVLLPPEADVTRALACFRVLEEEDPSLAVEWSGETKSISVRLSGEVQTEVLKRRMAERFGLDVAFGAERIVYRETIAEPSIGIGHYEPLRHYAEVQLLLEPGAPGSGVQLAADCPESGLRFPWQQLVLTHLAEKTYRGVLLNAPLTDIRITLIAGRAHEKHTEGGDFREATYRAVRQGLMGAKGVILEPWYRFTLRLPTAQLGHALSDLTQMRAEPDPPETDGTESILSGAAPVRHLRTYASELAAYTRGLGRLSLFAGDYRPLPEDEAEALIAEVGYDAERDVADPADSVFCSHGAGEVVYWADVPSRAHIPPRRLSAAPKDEAPAAPQKRAVSSYAGTAAEDKELRAIFERTYGPIRERRAPSATVRRPPSGDSGGKGAPAKKPPAGPEYLLCDGYNLIFAWDELKAIARENLDAARKALCDLLCNYQAVRGSQLILVFDAYRVPGNPGSVERYHNITVVYTKEAETADAYIERATFALSPDRRVRVATSDGPEQLIILGHGALRVPARSFREEVQNAIGALRNAIAQNNRPVKAGAVRAALERAQDVKQAQTDGKEP